MSSSPPEKPGIAKPKARKSWKTSLRPAFRWRGLRWARQKWGSFPAALQIAVVVVTILTAVALSSVAYQVIRKPTELLFFVGGSLDKVPSETWREYSLLFRKFSTDSISPELLAALAQIESTGNPVARTYWRWRLTWNPFELYKPASSSVGLYQMTDGAYAEASRYCIRRHAVVKGDCWFNTLYLRGMPSHAIELASVYLDRNVEAVLATAPDKIATPQQKQDLAAVIHLCGAGPARGFARRGFRVMAGERCGDHLVTAYLAKVNGMKRKFLRLAANNQS